MDYDDFSSQCQFWTRFSEFLKQKYGYWQFIRGSIWRERYTVDISVINDKTGEVSLYYVTAYLDDDDQLHCGASRKS